MKIPDAFQLPAFFQPLWTIPKAIKNSSCCTAACDCDALRRVFSTSQGYPQNPSCASLIHLQRHHRNICTHDLIEQAFHVLRIRNEGAKVGVEDEKNLDDVRISSFGTWQPQSIWEGNSPFWSGVSKFQLDNKLSINHNSFSEVSSAVATKEDVSPLQARISLTSVQHPHIHIKSGSLLTSKSSNTPRRV